VPRRSLVLLFALAGLAPAAPARAQLDENPCLTAQAATLRCPDLVMKRPFGLYADRIRGRTLLRAGNSLDSVGQGPIELHGVRTGRTYYMRARQRIYERDGGRISVRTGARLYFKYAHLSRNWWKFLFAAKFELFRLDDDGKRAERRTRRGPKISYCLRDFRHTRRRLRGSPRRRVYPACSTNAHARRVTVGTSVGWSDVYPPSYPEQWIDVTRLRGCFAYVHTADPLNGIYESNEDNNSSTVVVGLPYRRGRPSPCPRDRGT
jgi:Lysyl oxidase